MLKVAVLVSGGGSNLQSIIDFEGSFEVSLVISNKKSAFGLIRAQNHNIPNYFVAKENRTNDILRLLNEYKIDLVVLAGYLSIIDAEIIEKHKIINIHPSLIPEFCGMGFYGERVHRAVFEAKATKTGATVHFVDAGVDTGEIILQESVDVEPCDTPDTIAKKVLEIEHRILPSVIEKISLKHLTGEKYESIN